VADCVGEVVGVGDLVPSVADADGVGDTLIVLDAEDVADDVAVAERVAVVDAVAVGVGLADHGTPAKPRYSDVPGANATGKPPLRYAPDAMENAHTAVLLDA